MPDAKLQLPIIYKQVLLTYFIVSGFALIDKERDWGWGFSLEGL